MAATDFYTANIDLSFPKFPVKNTGGTAITVGQLVKLDTANPLGATQGSVGVIPTVLVADVPFGFAAENIPAGQYGGVYGVDGQAIWGIALGAIAIGAKVGPSTTAGQVTTYTAANPSIGQALTAAVNAADPILVYIAKSLNA